MPIVGQDYREFILVDEIDGIVKVGKNLVALSLNLPTLWFLGSLVIFFESFFVY